MAIVTTTVRDCNTDKTVYTGTNTNIQLDPGRYQVSSAYRCGSTGPVTSLYADPATCFVLSAGGSQTVNLTE